jgi:hypothetical protein
VWATHENAEVWGQSTVSDIDTLRGRSHPDSPRPRARQLEDGEGLVLEFFEEWPYTPRGATVIDFICDPDSSGLEHLKRTGHNPGWVREEDRDDKTDRNDTQQRQTPSLRFLNWSEDEDHRLLHLEWKTRLVCGSHVSEIGEGSGSLGDAFMQRWEQLRLGL